SREPSIRTEKTDSADFPAERQLTLTLAGVGKRERKIAHYRRNNDGDVADPHWCMPVGDDDRSSHGNTRQIDERYDGENHPRNDVKSIHSHKSSRLQRRR